MRPIQDYAMIGDCRAAALVSRDGSVDWLCWPRFDSPSTLGALLDERAGHWSIAPTGPCRIERSYLENTSVLQTTFHSNGGTLVITDLMPVASQVEKRNLLLPEHELLRLVECTQGEVEVQMSFEPRPGYSRECPSIRDAGPLGIRIETSGGLLVLRADRPCQITHEGRVVARVLLRAGETFHLSLTLAVDWPAVLPPLGPWSRDTLDRSVAWWRSWAARATYRGPARDAVMRSALVLKLLVYAPSGAVVAAPTTSLPERVGGDLNWDYRYCWLRDASMTVRALFGLGYPEEAEAFVSWLLHTTRLTRPELRILYDLYGNRPTAERSLNHLQGYRGSRPVRIGNAATDQLQLDVYGEVLDAVAEFLRRGGACDRETQSLLRGFGDYVCRNWHRPDEGIWEPRSGRAHTTHSRVLCWTALDRLLALQAEGRVRGVRTAELERQRELIRHDVETRAWNPALQSYVARLDGDELDASLLLIAWYGFHEAASERMRLTYARIREQLEPRDGLLYRYRTDDSPGEGAFGICGFWGAEYLARGGGTVEQARVTLERLCAYANDVGLYAEEIDPTTGAALGNFPQAFTHVGLINAALSLVERMEAAKAGKSESRRARS